MGLSASMIGQWENDLRNPKYDTLRRIASALNVGWRELVSEEKRGQVIVDHVKNAQRMTAVYVTKQMMDDDAISSGKVSYHKLTEAEQYRAGFLQFHSDEDRIAFFYSHLNTDGKLVASKCFYQHLDKDKVGEVADYVEKLSEIPQYQRTEAPQSPPTPQEGKDTTPPPDAPQRPQEDES